MSLRRAVLAGTGVAIPPRVVPNALLSRVMETSDEWIVERSGVRERRFVEPGVASSDLGAEAARAAIADAGIAAGEIDYIVCATMTPDTYFPGCATLIQQKVGLRPLPALDIRQQCAGYAYGLQLVDALIRSGIANNVLLVGCDVHTALMPFSQASWDVLDGRGPRAAAARGDRLEQPLPPHDRALRRRSRGDGLPGRGAGTAAAASWAPRSTATAATRRSSTSPAPARPAVPGSRRSRSPPATPCR